MPLIAFTYYICFYLFCNILRCKNSGWELPISPLLSIALQFSPSRPIALTHLYDEYPAAPVPGRLHQARLLACLLGAAGLLCFPSSFLASPRRHREQRGSNIYLKSRHQVHQTLPSICLLISSVSRWRSPCLGFILRCAAPDCKVPSQPPPKSKTPTEPGRPLFFCAGTDQTEPPSQKKKKIHCALLHQPPG